MSIERDGSTRPIDPKLLASIRKVLREQRIPDSEHEDLCQRVRVAIHTSSRLPEAEPARTQYIHGIARNIGRKHRRAQSREADSVPIEDAELLLGAEPPPVEDWDLARKLHAEAVARDPQGADWLMRAKVYGDTEVRIATSDGVPVDRVRKRILRLVATMRSRSVALAGVAGVVLIAAFIAVWKIPSQPAPGTARPDDFGRPADTHHPLVHEQEAAAMRKAALEACGARQWKACMDGLDRARVIDPAGDAREDVQAARRVAASELARAGQGAP